MTKRDRVRRMLRNDPQRDWQQMARRVGCSVSTVRRVAAELGIGRYGATPRQRAEAALKAGPDRSYAGIAREVGCSSRTVRTAARRLGIPKRTGGKHGGVRRANHLRWHVRLDKPNPDCALCQAEASPEGSG